MVAGMAPVLCALDCGGRPVSPAAHCSPLLFPITHKRFVVIPEATRRDALLQLHNLQAGPLLRIRHPLGPGPGRVARERPVGVAGDARRDPFLQLHDLGAGPLLWLRSPGTVANERLAVIWRAPRRDALLQLDDLQPWSRL